MTGCTVPASAPLSLMLYRAGGTAGRLPHLMLYRVAYQDGRRLHQREGEGVCLVLVVEESLNDPSERRLSGLLLEEHDIPHTKAGNVLGLLTQKTEHGKVGSPVSPQLPREVDVSEGTPAQGRILPQAEVLTVKHSREHKPLVRQY